jgi:hypothetical protein
MAESHFYIGAVWLSEMGRCFAFHFALTVHQASAKDWSICGARRAACSSPIYWGHLRRGASKKEDILARDARASIPEDGTAASNQSQQLQYRKGSSQHAVAPQVKVFFPFLSSFFPFSAHRNLLPHLLLNHQTTAPAAQLSVRSHNATCSSRVKSQPQPFRGLGRGRSWPSWSGMPSCPGSARGFVCDTSLAHLLRGGRSSG